MVVDVPCKINDIAWCIRNYRGSKQPMQGIVSEIFFDQHMELVICLYHVGRGKWGEKIFGSEEATWKAIHKMEGK